MDEERKTAILDIYKWNNLNLGVVLGWSISNLEVINLDMVAG